MITFKSLLEEMVDLEGLTRYPEPAHSTRQSSSYDRRSVRPDQPGWFANGDAGHFVTSRELGEKTEAVLLDTIGPGSVVRVWTANPVGTLQIHVDDMAAPVIETDFRTLMEGKGALPYPFAAVCASGFNLYLPIPYARHCRVTVTGPTDAIKRLYYHVNYRTYIRETLVESFSMNDLQRCRPNMVRVAGRLLRPGRPPSTSSSLVEFSGTLEPGAHLSLFDLHRSGAIDELTVRLHADNLSCAMRQTLLQIAFDRSPSPQVDTPVGDYFGAGPGVAPFRSLPLEVGSNGEMISRFVMPFQEHALGLLWNRGTQPVTVRGQARLKPYQWSDRSMHFRARWRVDHDIVAASSREPAWPQRQIAAYDWPFLIAHGKGVYVGSGLTIFNPTSVTALSGGWWGEGDEKVYLDGEPFPSTFGTGSEDYFGYAWSSPDTFEHPFIAQPRCDGPGNRGVTVNGRWHFLDAMPFTTSLEFYMELLHHARTPNVVFSRTSYLYAMPGLRDDHVQITDRDLDMPSIDTWQVQPAANCTGNHTVIEAENTKWSSIGTVVSHPRFSNGAALLFRPQPSEGISSTITFDEDTEAELFVALDAGPSTAAVRITLESSGKHSRTIATAEVDLLSKLPCAREVRLAASPFQVTAGVYRLKIVRIGGPESEQPWELGVDYVRWVSLPTRPATGTSVRQ